MVVCPDGARCKLRDLLWYMVYIWFENVYPQTLQRKDFASFGQPTSLAAGTIVHE